MSNADPGTLADPLEAMPPPERVNYATGVLLAAEDFRDEQTYHRARLARLLSGLAGFGTLAGLRVTPPAADDAELELHVAPGLAIDRFGRLVEITEPYCIRIARWVAAALHAGAARHGASRAARQRRRSRSWPTCSSRHSPARARRRLPSPPARSMRSTPWCLRASRRRRSSSSSRAPRVDRIPIPGPRNFWPAPDAAAPAQLQAVLDRWEVGTAATAADGSLDPLRGARRGAQYGGGAARARDRAGDPGCGCARRACARNST